jgi:hypothetical protein
MSADRPSSSRGRALGLAAAALPVLPALLLAGLIARNAVDVVFGDQWDAAGWLLGVVDHGLRPSDLLVQHNEDRKLVSRIVTFVVARTFGWNVVAEMWTSFAFACLTSLGVLALLRATVAPRWSDAWPRWTLANLLVFGPAQWQNWLWGFQTALFVPGLLLVAGLFVARSRLPLGGRAAVGAACAALATFSNGNGALLFLLLPLALFDPSRDAPARLRAFIRAWIVAAGVTLGLFFVGYTPYSPRPATETLRHGAGDAVRYALAFLGNPLVAAGQPGALPVAVALGAALFALFVVFGRHAAADAERRARAAPWVALGAFPILSAVIAAAARLAFGPEQALASRYATFALWLPVALVAMVTAAVADAGTDRDRVAARRRIAASGALLLVALHAWASLDGVRMMGLVRKERLRGKATLTLIRQRFFGRELALRLYPFVERLPAWAEGLDAHGLLRPGLLPASGGVLGYAASSDPERVVAGVLEAAEAPKPGVIRVSGWAIHAHRAEPADAVIVEAVAPSGTTLVAFAVTAIARPEVTRVLGSARVLESGFSADIAAAELPADVTALRAWAFDALQARAYRLRGEIALRQSRP